LGALILAKRQVTFIVAIISVYLGRAMLGMGEIERATKIIMEGYMPVMQWIKESSLFVLIFWGRLPGIEKEYHMPFFYSVPPPNCVHGSALSLVWQTIL